jgi:hypothetical protein
MCRWLRAEESFRMLPPRLFLLLAVLLGLGLTGASASRVAGAPVEGAKWAVLVGVSDYENEEINDLRFAVRDARALADALVQKAGFPKSHVLLLTSDSKFGPDVPSNANISRRIATLAGSIQPQDTFLFYFSGHGFSREGQGFLGTINTDPVSLPTLKVSSLPLTLLREQIHNGRDLTGGAAFPLFPLGAGYPRSGWWRLGVLAVQRPAILRNELGLGLRSVPARLRSPVLRRGGVGFAQAAFYSRHEPIRSQPVRRGGSWIC